jgi:hypothetical protein
MVTNVMASFSCHVVERVFFETTAIEEISNWIGDSEWICDVTGDFVLFVDESGF